MIVNGTTYNDATAQVVIDVLERARVSRDRIRIVLGDIATGRSWEESNDVAGYVGRSTGSIKVPLLVHNARSSGGGHMLDHCIIAIRYSNRSRAGYLYRHKLYTGNE